MANSGRSLLGCSFLSLAVLVAAACAPTSTGLVVESVDDYSLRNGPPLSNSVANGDGFIREMTIAGSPWHLTTKWTDRAVYDTDFFDNNLVSFGNDQFNFDRAGVAISYFTGHGFCNSGCSTQSCTTTKACTNPASGGQPPGTPGTCRFSPLDNPRCCYYTDGMAATAGTFDQAAGVVDYSSGPIRWGESATSGPWAQAGTDGGANLVILDISCGILPPFWYQELRNAVGGVHMIATILVAGGDTANVANRGSTFGKTWAAHPDDGQVAQAWLDTMAALPGDEGGACKDLGGGHGFNGCGCNIVVAIDSTPQGAASKISETWSDLRSDDRDAKGNNWYSARWTCNYTLPSGDQTAWELP